MARKRPIDASVLNHLRRMLTSKSTAARERYVLAGYLNIFIGKSLDGENVECGRCDDDINFRGIEFQLVEHIVCELSGEFHRAIAFPVGADKKFASTFHGNNFTLTGSGAFRESW